MNMADTLLSRYEACMRKMLSMEADMNRLRCEAIANASLSQDLEACQEERNAYLAELTALRAKQSEPNIEINELKDRIAELSNNKQFKVCMRPRHEGHPRYSLEITSISQAGSVTTLNVNAPAVTDWS